MHRSEPERRNETAQLEMPKTTSVNFRTKRVKTAWGSLLELHDVNPAISAKKIVVDYIPGRLIIVKDKAVRKKPAKQNHVQQERWSVVRSSSL